MTSGTCGVKPQGFGGRYFESGRLQGGALNGLDLLRHVQLNWDMGNLDAWSTP